MATRTSALDRVEAELHQAAEQQRAYSSFGVSLHEKKDMKHIAWSEKKLLPHPHLTLVERKGEALLTCDVEYR